jgi:DNA-nicking Smr family endonuclease
MVSEPTGSEDPPFESPVILPLKDSIDLHPFAPNDIPSVVEEYLAECCKAGFHEVRLIHGRGKGIQRRMVRSLLEKHPQVHWFKDAPTEAGGWGATVVGLKAGSSSQRRPNDKS